MEDDDLVSGAIVGWWQLAFSDLCSVIHLRMGNAHRPYCREQNHQPKSYQPHRAIPPKIPIWHHHSGTSRAVQTHRHREPRSGVAIHLPGHKRDTAPHPESWVATLRVREGRNDGGAKKNAARVTIPRRVRNFVPLQTASRIKIYSAACGGKNSASSIPSAFATPRPYAGSAFKQLPICRN